MISLSIPHAHDIRIQTNFFVRSAHREIHTIKSNTKISTNSACRSKQKIFHNFHFSSYYPGQKKRTILEIRGEKNAVPRVISCSIGRDQRRAKVTDSRGSDLPCADRAWSSMISHVEQRSSRRESRWWFFFFLSRVVAAVTLQKQEISGNWRQLANRTSTNRNTQQVPYDLCAFHVQGARMKALYDYTAADDDEVSFMENDIACDVEVIDEGWITCTIERTGERGMAPSNYFENC